MAKKKKKVELSDAVFLQMKGGAVPVRFINLNENETSKQAQTERSKLTIEAWEAYAGLEAAFNHAIECVERNYQDKDNWRLMRPEIESFFADVTHYLRIAIFDPKNEGGNEQ